MASYEDLPIRLQGDGIDIAARIGVKARIEGAVRVKPG